MLLSVIIFLLSIIPSVLIIVWMFKRRKEDLLYKKSCKGALGRGLLSVLPILLLSGALYFLNSFLKSTVFKGIPVLAYEAIYKFVVLAFAEEIIKYAMLRRTLKKGSGYSWADVVAFMVIIGTAFGLVEDIPYALGADAMTMLIRGFTMGHVGYGFMMGWFYGKSLKTGKRRYDVIAVLFPWFLHGLYDFSLTEELTDINDNLMFIAFLMALLDVVLLILMIRFFVRVRKRKIEKYLELLVPAIGIPGGEEPAAQEAIEAQDAPGQETAPTDPEETHDEPEEKTE